MGRHDAALRDDEGKSPPVLFGVVVYALEQYGNLVHVASASPFVSQTDFGYGAPIYKGSDAIKAGLESAVSALDKFNVYFRHAVLDEAERVRFTHAFRAQYLKKFPGSERTDLFLASGDVLKFAVELVHPTTLAEPHQALMAIESTPHDNEVLLQLKSGQAIDRAHLKAEFRIYLDHVMNPRRREVPTVAQAAMEMGTEEPYVVEVITTGAIPGYLYWVLNPIVQQVGGKLVLLGDG
jgi:hypothetical protein